MVMLTVPPKGAPRYRDLMELAPLTLEQYHGMIEQGIVGEDDPVELINGYLVLKDQGRGPGTGHGPTHAGITDRVQKVMIAALGAGWAVRCQLPITLGNSVLGLGREPEPDLAVAKGTADDYFDHHPGPKELLLVAEVADTSLDYDRTVKANLYASANIATYWIINLADRELIVFSSPNAKQDRYRTTRTYGDTEGVTLKRRGSTPVTLAVRDLLP